MKKWTQAWLDYTPRKIGEEVRFLNQVAVDGFDIKNAVIHNALAELQNGVKGMAGITMDISAVKSVESGIEITRDTDIDAEGYCIWEAGGILNLKASDAKGVLYGVFCILRQLAMEKALQGIHISCRPDNPLRMYNHWDNMDGSIERDEGLLPSGFQWGNQRCRHK